MQERKTYSTPSVNKSGRRRVQNVHKICTVSSDTFSILKVGVENVYKTCTTGVHFV